MDSVAGLRAFELRGMVLLEELSKHVTGQSRVVVLPDGELELRRTSRRELIVVAFSRFTWLADSCGVGQPHAIISAADLERAGSQIEGTVLVALDMWVPEGHRYPEPDPREQPPPQRLDEVGYDATVWIPTHPVRSGDRRVTAELHAEEPGSPLLCVYTSLDRLRASCGGYQAAAAIEGHRIDEVAARAGAHGVAFNPVLDEKVRHTGVVQNRPQRRRFTKAVCSWNNGAGRSDRRCRSRTRTSFSIRHRPSRSATVCR